jgi:hypothetical protein
VKNQAPFLDISSFVVEEVSRDVPETSIPASSPFLSLYEASEGDGPVSPEAQEYVAFLNELYDEEFDEALSALVDEARTLYETHLAQEGEAPQAAGHQAERLLNQHFAPLAAEAEAMFSALARELDQRDPNALGEDEIDTIVDRYQPSGELTPSFEDFLGVLKKAIKKVAKRAVGLAKKGIKLATKLLPIGQILGRLLPLVRPLIQRVIQTAIGKLPPHLQPVARKLAERYGLQKETGAAAPTGPASADAAPADASDVAKIQQEFDERLTALLFAPTEVEQDLEVARVLAEQPAPGAYPLAELDGARERFVQSLSRLREGEDPTPYVEEFLPAILPVLKVGIRLAGRKRVVDFLARFVARLIQRFVGPQYAPALSQAIVDAGLRLIQLEATPEDESHAAASAVAATVEETVRRVAALPDYVLDDQELLEGLALEAFEQAAAANLPQVLPEAAYRQRPDLGEARKLRGAWIMMPRGRRKRYKKFTRRIHIRLTPHKVSAIESSGGVPLAQFLEEELGVAPGEEVEAVVHLYEAIPGTRLSDIARLDEDAPGLKAQDGYEQLHPLTRDAAAQLLGEPDLGREVDPGGLGAGGGAEAGQRYYYLEIPGKRPLAAPGPAGSAPRRRPTRLRLILDFPKNEIRVALFLSEIRAQEVAVKLRQRAHIGVVVAHLQGFVERGLRRALGGGYGRLKIVHEAVTPDQWTSAFRRVPSVVTQALTGRLNQWVLTGLAAHLKQHADEFISAAENTADGVMLLVTIGTPPGFPELRQALRGKGLSLGSLSMSGGAPLVNVRVTPGYAHE